MNSEAIAAQLLAGRYKDHPIVRRFARNARVIQSMRECEVTFIESDVLEKTVEDGLYFVTPETAITDRISAGLRMLDVEPPGPGEAIMICHPELRADAEELVRNVRG